jgi:hypothetical protein
MFATVIAAWFAGTGPAIFTGAVGIATMCTRFSPRPRTPPGHLPAVRPALFGGFVVGTAIVPTHA